MTFPKDRLPHLHDKNAKTAEMVDNNGYGSEIVKHFELITLQDEEGHSKSSSNTEKRKIPEEVATAPLFSLPAKAALLREYSPTDDGNPVYPQYGLLGHRNEMPDGPISSDSLVYTNTAAPWSAFICGSQGSGKSHSLSCLLENCLMKDSPAGKLTAPLAGMIFHYDKFTAFSNTQLCEAAYLCSAGIPVRVLVSPTNYMAMKNAYSQLPGLGNVASKLKVEPMCLPLKGLNIAMMKTLMGIDDQATQPLYMEVVMKILRDMAIANQGHESFDYKRFRTQLDAETFLKGQQVPLHMRLDVLESFFEPGVIPQGDGKPCKPSRTDQIWNFKPGTLTIVDLSCPFVGPEDAFALFNICTSLFLRDRHQAGRVLAFDEAHKFLSATSSEAVNLTETLLSIVRQQRHLGTRVLIATQESTISPTLLDLCNLTIIHRFTSPAWFKSIKAHIAGAHNATEDRETSEQDLFRQIVRLKTGEALVFCPTALLATSKSSRANDHYDSYDDDDNDEAGTNGVSDDHRECKATQLGTGHVHLRVRKRVTADGGRSITAQ
ncbi:hypothetical protein PDE_08944 [Penicillium oxalicum 114-2]|uniref:Zona occludens toxin N-terminal domain-containing protein n=1 Tax=Penicillium oxalicum (strain 114-2 / CGMCC 5302) TaxID=933388 RepID=S8BFU7_PENO1|nr:hypothetical protein PDE_08944 [Penicillium oxalicum 114-2]